MSKDKAKAKGLVSMSRRKKVCTTKAFDKAVRFKARSVATTSMRGASGFLIGCSTSKGVV